MCYEKKIIQFGVFGSYFIDVESVPATNCCDIIHEVARVHVALFSCCDCTQGNGVINSTTSECSHRFAKNTVS